MIALVLSCYAITLKFKIISHPKKNAIRSIFRIPQASVTLSHHVSHFLTHRNCELPLHMLQARQKSSRACNTPNKNLHVHRQTSHFMFFRTCTSQWYHRWLFAQMSQLCAHTVCVAIHKWKCECKCLAIKIHTMSWNQCFLFVTWSMRRFLDKKLIWFQFCAECRIVFNPTKQNTFWWTINSEFILNTFMLGLFTFRLSNHEHIERLLSVLNDYLLKTQYKTNVHNFQTDTQSSEVYCDVNSNSTIKIWDTFFWSFWNYKTDKTQYVSPVQVQTEATAQQ